MQADCRAAPLGILRMHRPMAPYKPLFHNPHLQTILANYWKRPVSEDRFPIERRLYRTEPDVQVCVWTQRPAQPRGDLVMVHGLEGSGDSGYIRSLSAAALASGFSRPIASTCALAAAPGALQDPVPRRPDQRPSVGPPPASRRRTAARLPGGLLAGRQRGAQTRRRAWSGGHGTPARCLRRLHPARSRRLRAAHRAARQSLYERRFVQRMRARLCATGRYQLRDFEAPALRVGPRRPVHRALLRFRRCGELLSTQSADSFPVGIRVPALLHAVRGRYLRSVRIFRDPAVRSNPCIQVVATELRRPSRLHRTRASPLVGGSGHNELDRKVIFKSGTE